MGIDSENKIPWMCVHRPVNKGGGREIFGTILSKFYYNKTTIIFTR